MPIQRRKGAIKGRFLDMYISLIGDMVYLSAQPAKSACEAIFSSPKPERAKPAEEKMTEKIFFRAMQSIVPTVIKRPPITIAIPEKESEAVYFSQSNAKSEPLYRINIPIPDKIFMARGYIIVSTARIIFRILSAKPSFRRISVLFFLFIKAPVKNWK